MTSRGPCDEAEHANDPRCAPGGDRDDDGRGRDHPEDDVAGNVGDDNAGVDISGPCDEAEHANDPRCTGAIPVGDDDRVDNSGPGSLNSGPGSVNSGTTTTVTTTTRATARAAPAATTTRADTEVAARTTSPPPAFGTDGAAVRRPVAVPAAYDPGVAVRRRRVLLVEDERSISGPLADALEREGFDATVAETAAEALERARTIEPDLVLLDLMLPDGSGFDVCRELRSERDVPIVMLTARGDEADRIIGLELGADDYVVKPFSAREVIARVRAVLRRTSASPPEQAARPIEIGDLQLDPSRRSVALDGSDARPLAQGVRTAPPPDARRRLRSDARTADRGRLGHELVRLDEDARRARLESAPQARRRSGRAPLPPHRARGWFPVCGPLGLRLSEAQVSLR